MADDLEPVRQRFEADLSRYVAEVQRGADDARRFADANAEASVSVGHMRDEALTAGSALGDLFRHSDEVIRVQHGMRDSVLETSLAVGHLRDNALEAAAAEKRMNDASSGLGSRLSGLMSRLSGLFSGGGGEGGGASGLASVLANPAALVAIIPAVAALAAEAAGLAAGLAAAGAGAGAFAALAIPAFDKVKNAYTGINAAQQKLATAQLNERLAPSKAHLAAIQTALLGVKDAWAGLNPAEAGAVKGLQAFMDTYHKLAQAFEPQAFKIFADVMKIANQLLPVVTPFANTFASALDGLLQRVGKFTGSTGFRDWLNQFHSLEGPAITAIGNGIGKVGVAIGHLLTVMSKKDVVNAINIAFGLLAGTINLFTGFVQVSMKAWDKFAAGLHDKAHAFDEARHAIASAGHGIAQTFDDVRHDAANMAHNLASYFDEARANIHRWYSDTVNDVMRVVSWFGRLPGEILRGLGDLGHLLWNTGVQLVEGFINGILSMGAAVGNALLSLLPGPVRQFASWLGIGSPSRLFHEFGVNTLQGYINGVKAMAPQVRAAMAAVGGQVAAGGLPGVTAGGGIAGTAQPSVHVTVPVTLTGNAQLMYNSPAFYQYLQTIVQEAVLRWGLGNPGNGFGLPGRA